MHANSTGNGSGGCVVSVNEAPARGLRHRIVSDIAAAERASAQLISCAANLVKIGPSPSDMQAEPTGLGGEG